MANDRGVTETSLATAALVIALCSLFITTCQLLGQYFATADGYRRCQPSVMGRWAKMTRLRWRWSQFRFEILFTTPEILLVPVSIGEVTQKVSRGYKPQHDFEIITGSPSSKDATLVDASYDSDPDNERVCWLSFLGSLHHRESELHQLGVYTSLAAQSLGRHQLVRPALYFRRRSWDFMSPDIVRPLASTNVSDLAVMALRLGMIWKDFRPEDGIMRAEGDGHLISSTMTRSVGLIIHYLNDLSQSTSKSGLIPASPNRILYIPTSDVDRMGFGILPGCQTLGLPDFKIGSLAEVLSTMNMLDNSGKGCQSIKNVRSIEPRVTFGFSDLIPLAAPMLRLRGSSIIRVPTPAEYCVGLTCHKEGFVVFYHRLENYINERHGAVSEQTQWVLKQYKNLKEQFFEWEDEVEANRQGNSRDIHFLETVHSCWDSATEYFVDLEDTFTGNGSRFRYYDLMACHISHAVRYWGDAWSHIRGDNGKKARDHYGLRNWIAEGAHMYFDYLPSIVSHMRGKGFDDKDILHEAWFTMMFRAFCWWRCHYMTDGQDMIHDPYILPSRYWGSKLPVYMG